MGEDTAVAEGGRGKRLFGALLLTLASAIVPGTAHLFRRRWWIGIPLVCGLILLVAAALVLATVYRRALIHALVRPGWLIAVIVILALLAIAWATVVAWSYLTVRPRPLTGVPRWIAAGAVGVLCLLVLAPFAVAARYASVERDLVTSVFATSAPPAPHAVVTGRDRDPWQGKGRLNILLIGADSDVKRFGLRTDALVVASINPRTGRTVLLSVPRNMQHVPLPPGRMRRHFPHGFPNYIYALYQFAAEHPKLTPHPRHRDAELVKRTIGHLIGLPIDYYALADLDGFQDIVNALGGVWMRVDQPIRYGKRGQFVIKPGYRKLNGRNALWYARSRLQSSDYVRMRRQRCLIGAIARQADPVTVLRHFQAIAHATKHTVSTDIPQDLLPNLVDLAMKVKHAKITNIQLVPPVIDPADPHVKHIHAIVHRAIKNSRHHAKPESPVRAERPGSRSPAHAGHAKKPKPPTEQQPKGKSVSLSSVCPSP
ncbi:MAG: LCP family protein [Streptosporangiaceae bacterium]